MSGEKPGLEDVEKLLREVYERAEMARARIGVLVKDMGEAVERLEEGLKHGDMHVVDEAVDELKTLIKYLDKTVYGHVLHVAIKISEAGLKTAELVAEQREKEAGEQ
jgi:uncharacterized protein YjaG (DUF416 family)